MKPLDIAPVTSDTPFPVQSALESDHAVARDAVLVFEQPAARETLAKLLKQLNCAAVLPEDVGAPPSVMAPGLRAAIVSDAIDDPIGLCASLPRGLPKILVSSESSFSFRCAAARAGVEAIIRRPISVNELSDWLEHFESRVLTAPISVLLIDDHVLTAELHAAVLQSDGMIVRIVNHPAEALKAIEEVSPDLILMDVEMPEVDGIDLARVIRQSREYLSIPIAFLSAERDERRQMAARECGGDDFIHKPVDLNRLAGLVRLRAERARAMRSLIERDSLTGLLNHGRFQERVSIEFERSRRTGSTFSLAMIDIDHFKRVNDTFGHPAGDKVIRALARALMGRLRSSDVIGRYGGEEFGVMLVESAPEVARDVIDLLRRRFGDILFEEPDGAFSVTFSAGISGSGAKDVPHLFGAADAALYRAKRGGRDRVEIVAAEDVPLRAQAEAVESPPR